MAENVFPHKDLAKLSYEFVAVIGHQNPDHGEGDYIFGREKKHMCAIYDLPNCQAHVDMARALNNRGLLKDVKGTPTHIIYDPRDMSEISRAHGMAVSNIEDAIAEAQKKIGKPVRWREYAKMSETIESAREHVAAKDWRKAIKDLRHFDAKGMKNLEDEAKSMMETILEAGRARIAEAKTAADAGDVKKAKGILRDVERDFRYTEVEDEAKALVRELKD